MTGYSSRNTANGMLTGTASIAPVATNTAANVSYPTRPQMGAAGQPGSTAQGSMPGGLPGSVAPGGLPGMAQGMPGAENAFAPGGGIPNPAILQELEKMGMGSDANGQNPAVAAGQGAFGQMPSAMGGMTGHMGQGQLFNQGNMIGAGQPRSGFGGGKGAFAGVGLGGGRR